MAFSHGELLKFLRREMGMTQMQAAQLLDKYLTGRNPLGGEDASVRTAIAQFESGRRGIPHLYRVAISEGFKIPLDWFTMPWASEKAFAAALRRHRAAKGKASAPTLSQIAASFAGATLVEALPQADTDHHSSSRKALFERFRDELQAPGPSVLVVEGVSGYGKSSFVSLAIRRIDRLRIPQLVLAVQCMDRTGEQIVRNITELVHSADDRIKSESPQLIFEHLPTIVILDDADKIAGASERGGAPITGALLADLFAAPIQRRCRLKVVLTMRSSSGPAATLFEELSLLTGRPSIQPLRLDPLTTEDVAAVIRKKLKYENERSRHFAQLIGGDPIVVSTFVAIGADQRRGRTMPSLEVVASNLADGQLPEFEERTSEMRPLLDIVEGRGRVGLLTAALLTFSPGMLDLNRCQRVVDMLVADGILPERPKAIADNSVRAVLREVLDDFTMTNGAQAELHSRVKATFRALIGERIGKAALRQIHRRMAQSAVEPAVLVDGKGPTPLNFSSYYAILHHLIALYWLAPAAKRDQFVIQRKRTTALPSANDFRALEALLESDERLQDRADIVNVTYAALMLSSVDPDHGTRVASRQFGDYERKLKMLTMFTREGLREKSALSPLPELAKPYTVKLLLDIAVCAHQSGLLEIAREAIRARPRFQQECATTLLLQIRERLEAGVEDEDPELGRLIQAFEADSEYLNVHATVLIREGRFSEAIDLLHGHAVDSRAMVHVVRSRRESVARLRRKSRLPLATLLVACRRLLSKRAHLLVLEGRSNDAVEWFGLALQIDALRHKIAANPEQAPLALFPEHATKLSGEAGRAYCCMLMHGRCADELGEVARHIDDNIQRAETFQRHYEQIPWLVLRASLERLRGQGAAAAKSLKEAEKLRIRHGVTISFPSSVIMSLERERQRIRARDWRGSSPKLASMYKIASGSDHAILACDVALMLAESAPSREARHQWLTEAIRIVNQGYGFRRLDLRRIEADGPFADLL